MEALEGIKISIDKLKELQGDDFKAGIDVICRALQKIKGESVESLKLTKDVVKASFDSDKLQRFDILQKILLKTDKWHEATSPKLIIDINNVGQMRENAINILDDYISIPIKGKRFVEYYSRDGGYVSKIATERGATASLNDCTNLPDSIDVAYSFDCLEYTPNIKDKLLKIHSCIKQDGRYFLRVHNFFSRYASRLYRKYNYAYIHLVLTSDEIKTVFPDADKYMVTHYGLKEEIFGESTYDKLITDCGFKILQKIPTFESVENFFLLDGIMNRIRSVHPIVVDYTNQQLSNLMECQFIDYILGK